MSIVGPSTRALGKEIYQINTIAIGPLPVWPLLDDEGVRELRERSVEAKSEGLTESPPELGETLPPGWGRHAPPRLGLRAHP